MCEGSLTSLHKRSMTASSSSSQAIQCVNGHSILTRSMSDRSFQTLSTCSSVELSWSPVGSDSIFIKITWPHWSMLAYLLSHSRPTWKHSVTACLHTFTALARKNNSEWTSEE